VKHNTNWPPACVFVDNNLTDAYEKQTQDRYTGFPVQNFLLQAINFSIVLTGAPLILVAIPLGYLDRNQIQNHLIRNKFGEFFIDGKPSRRGRELIVRKVK
jgi:hypothetical protein